MVLRHSIINERGHKIMLGNKEIMAQNIRRLMDQKGVKSVDVCDALDIPSSTFSSWITAVMYPRIDKIEMMARYFNCSKADLVEDQFSMVRTVELSTEEYGLISVFRSADEPTKEMIRRLLKYATERMDDNN